MDVRLNNIIFSIREKPIHHLMNLMVVLIVVAVSFLYYSFSMADAVCQGDCHSYIVLMGKSFPDEYISTLMKMWRSWGIPVTYSIFGVYNKESGHLIVTFQTVLGVSSWALFALSVASRYSGIKRKLLFSLLLVLAFSKQYYIFNKFIQSDSIALASVLLFLAAVMSFKSLWQRSQKATFVLLLVLSLFCAGTRDSNIMIVLGATILLMISNYRFISRYGSSAIMVGVPGFDTARR